MAGKAQLQLPDRTGSADDFEPDTERHGTFASNPLGKLIGKVSPLFCLLFRLVVRLSAGAINRVTDVVNRTVTEVLVSSFRIIIQLAFLVLVLLMLVQSMNNGLAALDSENVIIDTASYLKTALVNLIPTGSIFASTKLLICYSTGWGCSNPAQDGTEIITALTTRTNAEVGAVSAVLECITGLTQIRLELWDIHVHPSSNFV